MSEFNWPWQYAFPPFFTIQINAATKQKQIEAWTALVLDYCQFNKLYSLDVVEAHKSALFTNSSIKRQLPYEGVLLVFEQLQKTGHAEWTDKQKRRCHIYWRRPEEWAKLIYDWATANGFRNSICTFFELTQSEDNAKEAFHGLETEVLVKALKHLQSLGKAEVLLAEEGVKFF